MITIEQAIERAYTKYACLQNEDFYIERQRGLIVLRWHTFIDGFINLRRVMDVARYLRKYTDLPIYNSYGKMNV